jgi:O-acetyl-ADP-ribose deacetylase (regulator of RNase III)
LASHLDIVLDPENYTDEEKQQVLNLAEKSLKKTKNAQKQRKTMINYKPAGTDLFLEETESIVNAVNCQGISGSGIAYYVSLKFPQETKVYETMCADKAIAPGIVGVIPAKPTAGNPNIRYIFALPTIGTFEDFEKLDYAGKMNLVKIGVEDLRRVLLTLPQLKSISIPALGCGVAGLKWGDVKKIIEEFLSDVPQDVFVIEPRNKSVILDEEYEDDGEEYDNDDWDYQDEEQDDWEDEDKVIPVQYNLGYRGYKTPFISLGDTEQIKPF